MHAYKLDTTVTATTAPARAAADVALLNHLRVVALRCRAKRRADIFHACAALAADRDTARAAHAEVLVRCLPQVLDRQPVFLRPGEDAMSFDEAWVLRLARALAAGDLDSATFLLRSRVADHARRNLAFLVGSVAEAFDLV